MTRYRKLAAAAAAVCAVVVPAAGSAHAATTGASADGSAERNRNLLQAPPGGVFKPVADAASGKPLDGAVLGRDAEILGGSLG
ncbi:hypothetical protein AB0M39_10200 [Streptomyces sp. NPDC051907]|uniref:hypothetical protein n=1 Tax=Streptomyces sp. NPDC051907 TaxID=3155284 RepID=UPI00341F80EE